MLGGILRADLVENICPLAVASSAEIRPGELACFQAFRHFLDPIVIGLAVKIQLCHNAM